MSKLLKSLYPIVQYIFNSRSTINRFFLFKIPPPHFPSRKTIKILAKNGHLFFDREGKTCVYSKAAAFVTGGGGGGGGLVLLALRLET
jgi:hypothetical protein